MPERTVINDPLGEPYPWPKERPANEERPDHGRGDHLTVLPVGQPEGFASMKNQQVATNADLSPIRNCTPETVTAILANTDANIIMRPADTATAERIATDIGRTTKAAD